MTKNFIITEINKLIEAHHILEEFNNCIYNAFGGDVWSGSFSEGYNYHEALVFKLLIMHREVEELSNEFDVFTEAILCIAGNDVVIMSDSNGNIITEISTAEELYNYLMNIENFAPTLEEIS